MPPDSGDGGLTFAGERKPLRSGQLRTGAAFDQQRNEIANGAALESDECLFPDGRHAHSLRPERLNVNQSVGRWTL